MNAVTSKWHKGTGGPSGDECQNLIASPLEAADGHRGDGADNLVVADTLSAGSHPGSNMPGRRREDDSNLVTAFYPTGGSKDGFWQEELSPPKKVGTGVGAPAGIGISNASGVRRLTPTECERLQAWPDGWTNPDGNAPDSRRYAACGDGVTATVGEWIGRRILSPIGSAEISDG